LQEAGKLSKLRVMICGNDLSLSQELRSITEDTLRELQPEIFCTAGVSDILRRQELCHIALLGVSHPSAAGIESGKQLLNTSPGCQIIFISDNSDCVTDVYGTPHLCLILKERVGELLPKYLLRAVENVKDAANQVLTVTVHGSAWLLQQDEICYLERRGHNTYIIGRSHSEIVVAEKLNLLMQRLNPAVFCRCHVSYVVNFQNVAAYQKKQFTMKTGAIIPISRVNAAPVRAKFMEYLAGKG